MKPQKFEKILLTIVASFSLHYVNSQNTFPSSGPVGIGTTSVNASSILEVKSTTMGVLLPRMSKSQRDAIASPATGLLIYQTNSTPGFYYNTSTTSTPSWTALKVSDQWKIGGNSFTGTTTYKNIGSTNCYEVRIMVNNKTIMDFIPSCLGTATGEDEIRYLDGGLIGTGTKDWSAWYSSPASSLIQTDRVRISENDPSGVTKGFVYRAPGTNTTATFSAINTSTGPVSYSAILAYSFPSPGYGTGIKSVGGAAGIYGKGSGGAFAGATVYGIGGYAVGMPGIGTRVGVYGKADTASVGYGILGEAGNGNALARAGYFSGDIQYTGSLIGPSDMQLKENIQPFTGALDKLKLLKVKTYNFKPEYSFMHLASGQQIGLISQDLEKVFPELVIESVHPADYDQETREKISDEVHYKGLNYLGLIPVLIEGMNEQQMQIEELRKLKDDMIQLKNENIELKNQIAEIHRTLNSLNSKNGVGQETCKAMLEQNIPNPSSEKTVIRYFIPSGTDRATINIYSLDKVIIKSFPVTSTGNGELTISPGLLSAGNYLYELVIDSKVIDAKKMILTK